MIFTQKKNEYQQKRSDYKARKIVAGFLKVYNKKTKKACISLRLSVKWKCFGKEINEKRNE